MRTFTSWDWLIVTGYMAAMAYLAFYFTKKQKNIQDFCLAGRKMGWFPLALSILATGYSAISLVGAPTYIFRENLQLSAPNILFSLPLLLIVGMIMIPVLYRLKLYTVYEYLQQVGETVYAPLTDALQKDGLSALEKHWKDVFTKEEGKFSISYEDDTLVLTVDECPAVAHLKKTNCFHTDRFCESTVVVNETVCHRAGYKCSCEYERGIGKCVQKFWKDKE